MFGTWTVGGAYVFNIDESQSMEVTSNDAGGTSSSLALLGVPIRPGELICAIDGLEEGNHTLVLTNIGGEASDSNGLTSISTSDFTVDYALVS